MINIKLRSEYSFQKCFGPIAKLIEIVKNDGAAGLCDNHSTFGHVNFHSACKKAGIKPLLGLQVNVVKSLDKDAKQTKWTMTLIARNLAGLKEMYHLNTLAFEQMYYVPRLLMSQISELSDNLILLTGSNPPVLTSGAVTFSEVNPAYGHYNKLAKGRIVATSDVYFPTTADRAAYELIAEYPERKTTPQHILTEWDMEDLGFSAESIANTHVIADLVDQFDLPQGCMPGFPDATPLLDQCRAGAIKRKLQWTEEYEVRLQRELSLIADKKFENYFYMVADMQQWAKKHMLCGPARGSAAGSLVCYLLEITEVDPIPFGLLFERFIDITRKDLPDIDMDFPDTQRKEVVEYLKQKYGPENVAHIGTVTRYKAKSAIGEAAKKYKIPFADTVDVKGAIIERSGGDSRAAFCILDTFESLDVGREFIKKYPSMKNVAYIENHSRNSGCHAAGILVCSHPIKDCCSVGKDNVAQIDKHDAEKLDLLKMDILGLRTLSVLGSCMTYIGKHPSEIYNFPLEDKTAFDVLNKGKYYGIFQFEGYALQSLTKQMGIDCFNDIVAITALARPGPLHSGGTTNFIDAKTGKKEIEYDHPILADYLSETFGATVYQEQVMQISRGVGKLSWEDVSTLRKAMSKSLGEEFFNQYWVKFLAGAKENGLQEEEAAKVWKNMCSHGSWSFNKSHAVSYAMISYYCMYLKAHYPLEFALACLNNEKDQDSTIKLLRELVKEGYKYKPWDKDASEIEWSIQNGMLVGGLSGIKGIGPKTAETIIERRKAGLKLLPGQQKKLNEAITPWDDVFEIQSRFGDYYEDPEKYGVTSSHISKIVDVQEGVNDDYILIGKLKEKNLRDMNEYSNVVKRGGKLVKHNNLFLNLVLEDDTGSIIARIDRNKYKEWGLPIVETGKIGDIYLFKGSTKHGYKMIYIEKIRRIS